MNQIFGYSILLSLVVMFFCASFGAKRAVHDPTDVTKCIIILDGRLGADKITAISQAIMDFAKIDKDSLIYVSGKDALTYFDHELSTEEIKQIHSDTVFSDILVFSANETHQVKLKKHLLNDFHSDINDIAFQKLPGKITTAKSSPSYMRWGSLAFAFVLFFMLNKAVNRDFNKHKENLLKALADTHNTDSLLQKYFKKSLKMSFVASLVAFALYIPMFYLFKALFDWKIANFTIVNGLLIFLLALVVICGANWYCVRRNLKTL